jgi:rfaE bifunctional protein kinase chain/domain
MRVVDKIKEVSPKILVIGDIMLDRFIFGNVLRISPEAPVPVVRSIEEKYSLGGCGNVLRNLINLGVKASIISFVGKDQAGGKIKHHLKKKGISTKHIIQSESNQTTEKMRIVAEGQQVVRVDWDTKNLTDQNLNKVLKQFFKKITSVDGVIISDYNKGICTELVIKDIISKAKELQISVFVDPKGKKWNKYYGASIITPNLKEAEEALGRVLITDEDVETAGKEICENLNLDGCLITRGPNGMSYIGQDVRFHVSSEAKEIYDVSGAGDTVIASFAAGTLVGFDSETVTRFANKAAGIVVGHIGTSAITISELKEESS